jgi:undecaprenyl-diphosphatase
MWTAALHFQIPHGEDLRLLGWSAFPSDHATLFFGLATGIFFISRPLGWVAFSWVTVVIAFPALYLGIHWPTDIIAGAFLGAAFVHIAKIPAVRNSIAPFAARSYHQYPGIFFAILFLWSYEVTNLFEDGRRLLRLLWHQIPH